jgi:hypothetical protein
LTKETRRRVLREKDQGGAGLEGVDWRERVYEGIIICLSLTLETCSFTMPPAVALLNCMTIRELYYMFAVFFKNWNFSRVFSLYHNFAGRISEAAMGGARGRAVPRFAFYRALKYGCAQ